MALSIQQEAVVSRVGVLLANGVRAGLIVLARAGCGKTTTLVEVAKTLAVELKNTNEEVFFGAYNKAIAEEIKAKLLKAGLDPKKIAAGTMHSAGFSAWRRVAKNVQVNDKKVDQIISRLADELSAKAMVETNADRQTLLRAKAQAAQNYSGFVRKAVSLAKQRAFGFLCSYEDVSKWYELSSHFGLEEELAEDCPVNMEELIRLCIHVFKTSLEMDMVEVDFDDMISAPLVHNARMWPKRVVLLDEAQDTNPARRALAIKMLDPKKGLLIAVGDDRQAIYGFTGADGDSLDLIKVQMNAEVLPLNVTYRCPKAVVQVAQQWVPDIQAHKSAPEGVVRTSESLFSETLTKEDAILCRNTKPLVEIAYTLLRQGTACRVEGREIGQGLITLANRWKVTTLNGLLTRLSAYKEREISKWMAKGMEDKAQGVEDKVDTLVTIIDRLASEGKKNLSDLVDFINKLFGDTQGEQNALTLCTCHRSKGREWNRVFWFGANKYQPSRWAQKDWQIQQEYNLMYVAATRSKGELVFVPAPEESK